MVQDDAQVGASERPFTTLEGVGEAGLGHEIICFEYNGLVRTFCGAP